MQKDEPRGVSGGPQPAFICAARPAARRSSRCADCARARHKRVVVGHRTRDELGAGKKIGVRERPRQGARVGLHRMMTLRETAIETS